MGIVHGAVNLDNILIKTLKRDPYKDTFCCEVRLMDFNHIHPIGQKIKYETEDSYFLAPEIINGQKCDIHSDVWSASVIIYILLTGEMPLYGMG